jgi:hypothetical protein
MRLTGNASVSGTTVAAARARETQLLSDPAYGSRLQELGIQSIRYSEAIPGKRLSLAELNQRLSGK